MTEEGWPRTEAVDASALVAAVNAATGAELGYDGRLPGGNAGAVAAHRPDGTPLVLTRWTDRQLAGWPELEAQLNRLRPPVRHGSGSDVARWATVAERWTLLTP